MNAVIETDAAVSWRVQQDRPITELVGSESLGGSER